MSIGRFAVAVVCSTISVAGCARNTCFTRQTATNCCPQAAPSCNECSETVVVRDFQPTSVGPVTQYTTVVSGDIRDIQVDIRDLKQDSGIIKSDIGNIKASVQNLGDRVDSLEKRVP